MSLATHTPLRPLGRRTAPPSRWWRVAPGAVAAAGAAVVLIARPRPVDLAAQTYRVELFARHGLALWDGGWYGGHHLPGYSVLYPPLGALVGTTVVGALATVAAAVLFEPLARAHYGERARFGSLWFALASVTLLLSGRLSFALGVAFGLAALLAFTRGRPALACLLGAACGLASPVAALFLALCALAALRSSLPTRGAIALAAACLVPPAALVLAFPEGGYEPFATSAFWPLPVLALLAACLVPRSERALRAGALVYAAGGAAAYALNTPVGGNALRLGQLFGGPLVACALAASPPRRPALATASAVLVAALAWWQWSPAIGDVAKVASDPAASPAFYRPLVARLEHAGGPPGRVEIPFTRSHWEAAEVAPSYPLARGWERQLDIARNPLFYGRAPLTPATYRAWLDANAVRFVALPRAALDYSAKQEARLVERGLGYLALRWRSPNWRLYEVRDAAPIVQPFGSARMHLVRMANDELTIAVTHPGRARVAVAWSPYWYFGGGCVERDGSGTSIAGRRAGTFSLRISFALGRVFDRGPRCA